MNASRVVYLSAILVLFSTLGCDNIGKTIISTVTGPQLKGSGVTSSEYRQVEPFHALKTDGAIASNIAIGSERSIEISGDDNIVPIIKTEVRDGILHIRIDYQGSVSTKAPITATIVTPTLDGIELDGACNAEATGIQSTAFTVDLDGASHLTVDGRFQRFIVELDGASRLAISGTCDQLKADLDGAAKLRAVKLACENAEVKTDGASSAHVSVKDSLLADSDGASSIRYVGNPTVKKTRSGAASIKPMND